MLTHSHSLTRSFSLSHTLSIARSLACKHKVNCLFIILVIIWPNLSKLQCMSLFFILMHLCLLRLETIKFRDKHKKLSLKSNIFFLSKLFYQTLATCHCSHLYLLPLLFKSFEDWYSN